MAELAAIELQLDGLAQWFFMNIAKDMGRFGLP